MFDGYLFVVLSERLGQLPDVIERDMSDYWLNRWALFLEAEAINAKKPTSEQRKAGKR